MISGAQIGASRASRTPVGTWAVPGAWVAYELATRKVALPGSAGCKGSVNQKVLP
jgi:hypothetical protein